MVLQTGEHAKKTISRENFTDEIIPSVFQR
jgi:hypothetical protein